MTRFTSAVAVADHSQVGEARRLAQQIASASRFSENAMARIAIAVTELATNLVKHGGGGEILISTNGETAPEMDLVAIDKGRGIGSVTTAMQDGYSTAGSPGTGLGAVSRAATLFEVWSAPAHGTAILCRIIDEDRRRAPLLAGPQMAIGGLCIAKPRESQSGDAWDAARARQSVTIAVADGLGHGSEAANASTRAIGVFKEKGDWTAEQIVRAMHDPLRSTRGAAVAVARIHLDRGVLEFVGVGNIAGAVVTGGAVRRTVSMPGIAGHEMRKVQPFQYPWTGGSLLVMHSDGLSSSWSLDPYPGLGERDPSIIAAVLYRDFCRRTDDVTVVVAKP